MLFLSSHHIVDLYCWVDDLLPHAEKISGRPPTLSMSEVTTILVWHTVALRQKTLRTVYDTVSLYHKSDFPRFPSYSAFVSSVHRALPHMFYILSTLLCDEEAVRIIDATMLPVCKPHRADSHKVAKDIARFGKNWQG
jgi:hypothetical protein